MSDAETDDERDLRLLLEDLRNSSNPSWELFQSVFDKVESFVRQRMYAQLRGKIRPSDIAQSALKSWLGAVSNRESNWEGNELNYFKTIILNKIIGKLRYFTQGKRDIRRETATDLGAIPRDQELDSPLLESIAKETESLIYDLIKDEPHEIQMATTLKLFDGWSNAQVLEYLNSNGQQMSLRSLQLRFARLEKIVESRMETDST